MDSIFNNMIGVEGIINHLSNIVLTIFNTKGKALTNLGLQKVLNLTYNLYLKEYGVELFSKDLIVRTRYGISVTPINNKYRYLQSEIITNYSGIDLSKEDGKIIKVIEEVYNTVKELNVLQIRELEEFNIN